MGGGCHGNPFFFVKKGGEQHGDILRVTLYPHSISLLL